MAKTNGSSKGSSARIAKTPTGIQGLDDITGGGLPRGRPSLVCGGAGCGKTLLAMEFLVRGAVEQDEPGVFITFEETSDELAANVRSLGFDLEKLTEQKKLAIDHVVIASHEIVESGEYDLNGLFIRLGYAIDSIGAKRVVLDTIETLFGGFTNQSILRAELRRLFRWLKDKGVTAIITAERGEGSLTRQGLEEYVSDCVILLDHRVTDQISTRRLRVVKYRGTAHGTNEYPFLIDEDGFSVLPITSTGLNHEASDEQVSTGVARLDAMLGGRGAYRGSSILVSGTAGTGKSSLATVMARESCARGERCLYFAFEESESQIIRNMGSIGVDLRPWIKKGLLRFVAGRPTSTGLEMHLALMHRAIKQWKPRMVVVDPISNLVAAGVVRDATTMLTRLIDHLKTEQVTAVFTSLTKGNEQREETEVHVSSLIDTWLFLRSIELGGERNRGLCVLKSRGMAHSNQIREFLLTSRGIELMDVYVGDEGVLTGSMRMAQEARERAAEAEKVREADSRRRGSERRRRAIEAQIAALRAELDDEEAGGKREATDERERLARRTEGRNEMGRSRRADAAKSAGSEARSNNRSGARN